MTFAVFHDFPGVENGLPKFQDFPWLSRTSGHPALHILLVQPFYCLSNVMRSLWRYQRRSW